MIEVSYTIPRAIIQKREIPTSLDALEKEHRETYDELKKMGRMCKKIRKVLLLKEKHLLQLTERFNELDRELAIRKGKLKILPTRGRPKSGRAVKPKNELSLATMSFEDIVELAKKVGLHIDAQASIRKEANVVRS